VRAEALVAGTVARGPGGAIGGVDAAAVLADGWAYVLVDGWAYVLVDGWAYVLVDGWATVVVGLAGPALTGAGALRGG
jgi:hypothetical protein